MSPSLPAYYVYPRENYDNSGWLPTCIHTITFSLPIFNLPLPIGISLISFIDHHTAVPFHSSCLSTTILLCHFIHLVYRPPYFCVISFILSIDHHTAVQFHSSCLSTTILLCHFIHLVYRPPYFCAISFILSIDHHTSVPFSIYPICIDNNVDNWAEVLCQNTNQTSAFYLLRPSYNILLPLPRDIEVCTSRALSDPILPPSSHCILWSSLPSSVSWHVVRFRGLHYCCNVRVDRWFCLAGNTGTHCYDAPRL